MYFKVDLNSEKDPANHNLTVLDDLDSLEEAKDDSKHLRRNNHSRVLRQNRINQLSLSREDQSEFIIDNKSERSSESKISQFYEGCSDAV